MRHSRLGVGEFLSGFFVLLLSAFGPGFEVMAQTDQLVREFPLVTNVFHLRHAVSSNMGSICALCLEGTVLADDPSSGVIFFQDDTGTEILETSLEGLPLQPGQRVQLRGTNYVVSTEIGVSLGNPVVDNDGRHSKTERQAAVYLKAGRYPIQVLWFNYTGDYFLDAAYSGPNFARQTIPNSKLFRAKNSSADGKTDFTNGLNYRCYEGDWQKLPRFQTLKPVKAGVTSNFDLNVETRKEYVELAFDGFIEVESDGFYTFYLMSDDGSQFFIHNNIPIQLTVTGEGAMPAPRQITVRQPLPGDKGPFWAEVEGWVTFLGRQQNKQAELELTSEDSRMRVVVADAPVGLPRYLLGSRVRIRGICPDTSDTRGDRLADTLVIPNWKSVQALEVKPDFWSSAKSLKISDYKLMSGQNTSDMVRICGRLRAHAPGQLPDLEDDTGSVPVELLNSFPTQSVGEVECLGIWSQNGSNSVLREASWRELHKSPDKKTETNNLPVLTTAAQVQQLNREEAQRGYRVKLQGVVTWVAEPQDWIVLQDSTRGVSVVGLKQNWIGDAPKVGENLEIEGTCIAAEFSPIVVLNKAKRLGMGLLPVPMHPTWEQLVGGSMDAQYIEIGGLVTSSQDDNHLTLLMPNGKINVEFYPTPAGPLASFVESVVRIRGVMFANWDSATRLVTPDHPLRFGSATICVDTPPPLDPFNAIKMRARQLMQFDVQRNTFQRVNVSGQFLYGRAGTCYMIDDGFGWRFEPVQPEHFEPGDMVEVVGLVELGGTSPVLREAITRKTGHLPLPVPQPLVFDRTNATYDSSRVWVEGLLLSVKDNGSERLLEMQAGLKHFVARLLADDGAAVSWPVGSRLKLIGIFSDLGGSPQERQSVNFFELLLNSPADVELIARPPWWTLNRLLAMVTLLAAGLALAFIWISQLRRQVERRTVQLEREIGERQRVEQDQAVEQERSRIARDLHDDLGSRLTAINMLAITGPRTKLNPDASNERLQLIADRSRSMVTALDELVWAVNPKNDTVAALAEYLASFAEELLARTDIVYRVELPLDFPAQTIAAETRHNVLLSVKEALTNAIRHGRPGEVLLKLTLSGSELEILIKDNGCGFDTAHNMPGNGLANLKERMRKINGRCQIQSSLGTGTAIFLSLPM